MCILNNKIRNNKRQMNINNNYGNYKWCGKSLVDGWTGATHSSIHQTFGAGRLNAVLRIANSNQNMKRQIRQIINECFYSVCLSVSLLQNMIKPNPQFVCSNFTNFQLKICKTRYCCWKILTASTHNLYKYCMRLDMVVLLLKIKLILVFNCTT